MRLRIVRTPTESRIDGMRLDRFHVGAQYEIGTALGAVFLAEGWAVPVPDDAPAPAPRGVEYQPPASPPNLFRESYPAYYGEHSSSRPAAIRPEPGDRRAPRHSAHEHKTPPTDG